MGKYSYSIVPRVDAVVSSLDDLDMPIVSKRGAQAPSSPIRKLVPLADAARMSGRRIHHLNIGQPDMETPAVMRAALAEYGEKVIAYGPSGGDVEFRDVLFEYYRSLGIKLKPHELIVTTGASEAVHLALATCLDHGDELLVPDPMYANYLGYGGVLGNRIRPIPTSVETGYHLPDDLEAYLTPRTRAVLMCNPANPTGAVYSEEEVQRVLDLCVKHDLFIIADEVYREFVYDDDVCRSVLAYPEAVGRAVVVDSLSKRYSLCGARIGCFVTNNEEIAAAAMKLAQARLSPPALAQVVASRASRLPNDYFPRVKREYRQRRDTVYEALVDIPGVTVHRPEGAFYQMARLPVEDAETFVRYMLTEFHRDGQTVMLAPAAGFYAAPDAGRDEVRIAYVLEQEKLAQAMWLVEEALHQFNG